MIFLSFDKPLSMTLCCLGLCLGITIVVADMVHTNSTTKVLDILFMESSVLPMISTKHQSLSVTLGNREQESRQ